MAGYSTLEQFIKFSTDASGLERTFRLFQAVCMIISSSAAARSILLSFIHLVPLLSQYLLYRYLWGSPPVFSDPLTEAALYASARDLRSSFNLGRRFFRVFRFIEAFHSAFSLSTAPTPPLLHQRSSSLGVSVRSWIVWLDVGAKSFLGMYLLLETMTFPGALGQTGCFGLWSVETERVMNIEGQRFWFFSLVCAAVRGALKLGEHAVYRMEEDKEKVMKKWRIQQRQNQQEQGTQQTADEQEKTGEKGGKQGDETEKQRQERIDEMARFGPFWELQVGTRAIGIMRRLAADTLDLVLPGQIIGWVPVGPTTVGICMLMTTCLTGKEVWDRCGMELAQRKE
ncbi:peroxisomal biogenesis factor 11-domain-containing protein [Diplogelasinospora grovesii]|uniref:Peroxisomal biogenesis factor 11-domain-containing protein n=1 Tax=Diplogelasinospora grovesii TaxID=303347 RepID=A0AAN6SA73_9PEZI|nr:peroxisomal biogenesis factor 11-domain-containing protein [Diplogelasinospora grovesii]